jgi:hypothetical protein
MIRFKQFLLLENDAETGSFKIGQWSKNYKDEVDKIYKELYQKHKNDIDPIDLNTSFRGNVEDYIRAKFMNPEEREMAGRAASYMYSPLDIDDPNYEDSLVKQRYDPAAPRANNFKRAFYTHLELGPVSNKTLAGTTLVDYTKPVSDQDLSTTYPASDEIKPSTPAKEVDAKAGKNVIVNPPQSNASRWQSRFKSTGKAALKMVPVIGTAASIASMAQRAQAGDYVGAGLEAASEVADYIPVVGTAASLGIQGYLADKDMSEEERKKAVERRSMQALRAIQSPNF